MKLGVDNIGRLGREMAGGDPIGASKIAAVEQPAADDPLLDPPFAGLTRALLSLGMRARSFAASSYFFCLRRYSI